MLYKRRKDCNRKTFELLLKKKFLGIFSLLETMTKCMVARQLFKADVCMMKYMEILKTHCH